MGRAGRSRKGTTGHSGATLIASGNRFHGELSGDAALVVEGRVEGQLNITDHVLIARAGVVEGEVRADEVEVAGLLSGRVHCRVLTILPEGRVQGTVLCEQLNIAPNGEFRGQRQAPGLKLPLLQGNAPAEPEAVAAAS